MSVTVLLEIAVKPDVDMIGMMKQMLPDTRAYDAERSRIRGIFPRHQLLGT